LVSVRLWSAIHHSSIIVHQFPKREVNALHKTHLRVAVGLLGALMALAGAVGIGSLGQDNVPLAWDGYLILRIRVAAGGLTPAERAAVIQMRLQDLMADQFAREEEDVVGQITVRKVGREAVIEAPGRLLMTVTYNDARANHSTVWWLAQYWRARLLEAMIIATRTG